jgi:predicted N-acetyltransferase YhbS
VVAVMPVEMWDTRYFTPAQARAIGELIAAVWPKPTVTAADRAAKLLALGRDYEGPDAQAPRSFVFVEDGQVLAHAGIVPRQIATTAGEMTVAGLARVCTDPQARGRGLGELIARAAFGAVDGGDFPFALFQTSRRVQPFYDKLGAVVVDNPLVNSLADDPAANPFWDEVVMRYPVDGDWPTGTVDLRGSGF